MRPLLEDITSSVIKREEPAANDDGLTPEEKTQLRELCVLIVISEFLESNSETSCTQQGRQSRKDNFRHKDAESTE
jgi:hypothetical protein